MLVPFFGLLCAVLSACSKDETKAPEASASTSAKPRVPIDRLAPGELEPGRNALFGLLLPRDMQVQGKFKGSGLAVGRMSAERVANYVRDRVLVQNVEVGAARTVFPAASIKGGAEGRVFRIEVLRDGVLTRLVMEDITPPPEVKLAPMNRADAMRRAGFAPDGTPLDLKSLE